MELEKNIPEGWVETSIGELAELLTDYVANGSFASLKENVTYLRDGEGYARLIRLADHNKNYKGEAVFVNEHSYMFLKKSKLYPGDLIISNVGEYSGTLFRAPNLDIPMTLGPNSILMKFGESDDYMFYFLQGRVGKHLINTVKSGSANPKFNKTEFKKIEFIIPPLPEQKAIAKVLNVFDDKIKLLQAQNKTLETMAQTIFKEWFGKYQIGDELPQGWMLDSLGKAVKIKQGKYVKSEKISEIQNHEFKYPLYGGGGIRGYLQSYVYDTPQVILTCRGNGCGLIQLSKNYSTITNSCMTLEYDNSKLDFTFLYLFSKNINFEIYTSGSAQPQITVTNLEGLEIIIPNEIILKKFKGLVEPLFEKIKKNYYQIKSLTKTRDTLLPKLMSGQVRVNNIKNA